MNNEVTVKHRICSKCKLDKLAKEFYRNKKSPTGLGSWCKDCKIKYTIKHKVSVDHKICSKCKLNKPAKEFYKDDRNQTGLSRLCKVCKNPIKKKSNKTKTRGRKRSKYYFDNEKFISLLERRKALSEEGKEFRELQETEKELFLMMQLIVDRYGTKPNFSGYSYLHDMKIAALIILWTNIDKFNIEKSRNPLSYFTQATHNSFLQTIKKENLHLINHTDFYDITTQEFDGVDRGGKVVTQEKTWNK